MFAPANVGKFYFILSHARYFITCRARYFLFFDGKTFPWLKNRQQCWWFFSQAKRLPQKGGAVCARSKNQTLRP